MDVIFEELVHFARIALSGRRQDIQRFIERLAKKVRPLDEHAAEQLLSQLRIGQATPNPILRDASPQTPPPLPVDLDTRLQLVRQEYPVVVDAEPVWSPEIASALELLVRERRAAHELRAQGLSPSRSGLFVGPPGVGKTLAARWVARELDKPLVILDLAAVMSSFLGRTGNNLRYVLDYAKASPCVLLLDELDAIAKRRDDDVEVGELKRLVTVLLQEIDDWPSEGILLAATNHPELLDRAVWRRFENVFQFPLPDQDALTNMISGRLANSVKDVPSWARALSAVFAGASYSEVDRELNRSRRHAVLDAMPLADSLTALVRSRAESLKRPARIAAALQLEATGMSQREASEAMGVSRDTIRQQKRRRVG